MLIPIGRAYIKIFASGEVNPNYELFCIPDRETSFRGFSAGFLGTHNPKKNITAFF